MSHNFDTDAKRVSYGIGRQMGGQLAAQPFEGLDIDAVAKGVMDAFAGNADPIPQAEMEAAYETIRTLMEAEEKERAKELAAHGEAYLEENAKREEITVTDSGLQYEVITEGSGEKPTAASTVKTHYHGMLIDGTVFDSSVERGQPAEFPVSGVIAGWTEALQLMSVGSKYRLHIPHELAYGAQGAGDAIKPYQTLVFDVELLEITG